MYGPQLYDKRDADASRASRVGQLAGGGVGGESSANGRRSRAELPEDGEAALLCRAMYRRGACARRTCFRGDSVDNLVVNDGQAKQRVVVHSTVTA